MKGRHNMGTSMCTMQRRKNYQHNTTPVGKFMSPTSRFEHIHTDLVGFLPISNGYRYLTIID